MAMENHILQMVGFSRCHLGFRVFFQMICCDCLVEVVLAPIHSSPFENGHQLTGSSEIAVAKVQDDITCHLSRRMQERFD